jgi:hypothetical protein
MIHRLAVPPPVKAAQLRHLIKVVSTEDRITMRVLPSDVVVLGGFLPKASFSLYTFADPGDPPMAVVDTVTADVVLTQRQEAARYAGMYDRLRHAAMSVDDTLSFLDRVADRLTDQTESDT